ncbi:MAG TPA: aromatic aminobenezylarsenical efflux permease ArsG family transporter [Bacteroidales bacterium]|nr:aromatic aminobenezylarsenical efflux permease ArsG family transporter [Bacteroidales bacterium]
MEYLQHLIENSGFPIFSAFLIGLMVTLSPCQLMSNITAIAFIGRDIEQKRRVIWNSLIFVLGRMVTYLVLVIILYYGAKQLHIEKLFQYVEHYLGFIFVILGVLMLDLIPLRIPGLGKITNRIQQQGSSKGYITAFLLGVLLALSFCPHCIVLFFGMLVPLTIASPEGLLLPVIFAITTGLPVLIFSFLMAYSLAGISKWYNKIKNVEIWVRRGVALLFILIGLYFIISHFFGHHH